MSSEGVSPRTPASGRISPRSGSSGGSSDQLTPSLPAPKKKRNRIYTLEDQYDTEEENARYSESASFSSFIFALSYLSRSAAWSKADELAMDNLVEQVENRFLYFALKIVSNMFSLGLHPSSVSCATLLLY